MHSIFYTPPETKIPGYAPVHTDTQLVNYVSKTNFNHWAVSKHTTTHHNRHMVLFPDHPGETVPEENFWTLWCKGRLTEADTPSGRAPLNPD